MMENNLKRWRLILGDEVDTTVDNFTTLDLNDEEQLMDQALSAIYSKDDILNTSKGAGRGSSSPKLAKWLVDVRNVFPQDIVKVIQQDAIERKGLKQLLFEPELLETMTPDVNMACTLLALKEQIPSKSKEAARFFIKQIVDELIKSFEEDMRKAVSGALNKKNHSVIPHLPSMDWKRTIERNLKNYDVEKKRLIPERFYFYERRQRQNEWTIILDIDQSGSMMDSILYSTVMGSIFASMPVIDSKIVLFDTNVVDVTDMCQEDPIDLLFGINLGGGTDINKSVAYCRELVTNPSKTIFILISDLYEGGVESKLLNQLEYMKDSGVTCITLLALSDSGVPSYDEKLGKKISKLGIPSFACSPDKLPELIGEIMKGNDLKEYEGEFVKND